MDKSTATAIWAFDTSGPGILWGNRAAATLWGLVNCYSFDSLDPAAVAHAHRARSECQPFHITGLNSHQQLLFRAEKIGPTLFLINEVSEDGFVTQISSLTETPTGENYPVSIYDQRGHLILRSPGAKALLDDKETHFSERFIHPAEAHQVWLHLDMTDYFEGHYFVHSAQGERWHLLQAVRIYLSSDEWVVQLTEREMDQQIEQSEALRSLLREQQVIFEHAGTGICFTQERPGNVRQIMRCNERFAEMYGYSVEELLGQSSAILYPDEDEYSSVGTAAYPKLTDGSLYSHQLRMRRKDGSLFWTQIRGKIISNHEPALGYIWIIEDVDAHIQANLALESILQEQQLILDHAMVGIVFLKNRRVTRCNRRFEEIFGYQEGELQGAPSRAWYLTDKDWQHAGEACYVPLSEGDVFRSEMLLAHKDGTPIWCDVRSKAIDPNDLEKGSIWITMDITERKASDAALALANERLEQRVAERTNELAQVVNELHLEISERRIAEERIKHMALHDALTGLPNRILLEERLAQALTQAQQDSQQLAVLFLDLDRFKHINDSLGHHEGDQLLIQIANRLHDSVRPNDTVARLGGDEFVIVLNALDCPEALNRILDRIQQAFRKEIRLALEDIFVTPSIGVAIYPDDGTNAPELMKNADAAMYYAKDNGRNCLQFFNPDIDSTLKERLTLENALHQALKRDQFTVYYQPQVDVRSNQIIGAEALIRWQHPEKGLVPPASFIPLAEETGLIVEIGHWLLERVCQQLSEWHQAGYTGFQVSANLSALQVQQSGFNEEIANMLARYAVPPESLELELTESMIMRNADETIATLEQLHHTGFQISVDDFGTGYSSLSYLKRFPLDKLKIDRSFVTDITSDPDDAMICRTIISMAHNLNLKVIAEGVETKEQLALLRSYGCELYQGHLFSRPRPASDIPALIRDSHRYQL